MLVMEKDKDLHFWNGIPVIHKFKEIESLCISFPEISNSIITLGDVVFTDDKEENNILSNKLS